MNHQERQIQRFTAISKTFRKLKMLGLIGIQECREKIALEKMDKILEEAEEKTEALLKVLNIEQDNLK